MAINQQCNRVVAPSVAWQSSLETKCTRNAHRPVWHPIFLHLMPIHIYYIYDYIYYRYSIGTLVGRITNTWMHFLLAALHIRRRGRGRWERDQVVPVSSYSRNHFTWHRMARAVRFFSISTRRYGVCGLRIIAPVVAATGAFRDFFFSRCHLDL